MTLHHAFEWMIALHIASGAPGLVAFWLPIMAKKGAGLHKVAGRVFTFAMMFTGTVAISMSVTTLFAPMETHPQLLLHPEFSDPALVRGIFGWMMLYLAILTINLAWFGWRCIRNRADHARNRGPVNMALQVILLAASANCAVQGVLIGQAMMVGISMVGFATVATNLWFILKRKPGPVEWLTEHIKGIVGTGISVYTAFFAFGAVRFVPELALTPALWSVPLVTGLGLIIWHQRAVRQRLKPRKTAAAA